MGVLRSLEELEDSSSSSRMLSDMSGVLVGSFLVGKVIKGSANRSCESLSPLTRLDFLSELLLRLGCDENRFLKPLEITETFD